MILVGESLKAGWFAKWLVPAILFQSVFVGGGFGSGREVMEYAGKFGFYGLSSIAITFLGFVLTCTLSYELARVFKAFDYRSFAKQILWRFWPVYDVAFVLMAVIVIAVVGAAGGAVLEDAFGIPASVGAAFIIALTGLIIFLGRRAIESYVTVGTVLLYCVWIAMTTLVLYLRGDVALSNLREHVGAYGWGEASVAGLKYWGYNLVVVPAVFALLDRLESRKDSVVAGTLSSLFLTLLLVFTWLSFMAFYPDPEVVGADVPWYAIATKLGFGALLALYTVALFWTLAETSIGMIHAITVRVNRHLEEFLGRSLRRWQEGVL
ncbi:MAG TPA: hypothetical protein EYP90_09000, partial [Chromatiaceae bacterium]|nr:hypothetical protein [Chromatiaceae bacterium]